MTDRQLVAMAVGYAEAMAGGRILEVVAYRQARGSRQVAQALSTELGAGILGPKLVTSVRGKLAARPALFRT